MKYIANVAQRTFEIVQNRDHANIINYIDTKLRTANVRRPRVRASPKTSMYEVPVTFLESIL